MRAIRCTPTWSCRRRGLAVGPEGRRSAGLLVSFHNISADSSWPREPKIKYLLHGSFLSSIAPADAGWLDRHVSTNAERARRRPVAAARGRSMTGKAYDLSEETRQRLPFFFRRSRQHQISADAPAPSCGHELGSLMRLRLKWSAADEFRESARFASLPQFKTRRPWSGFAACVYYVSPHLLD